MPVAARRLIDDARNQLLFSAASLWEVAIKSGLGRTDFRADAGLLRRGLVDNSYDELAITGGHAVAIANLPPTRPRMRRCRRRPKRPSRCCGAEPTTSRCACGQSTTG